MSLFLVLRYVPGEVVDGIGEAAFGLAILEEGSCQQSDHGYYKVIL